MKKIFCRGMILLLVLAFLTGCTPAGNKENNSEKAEPIRTMQLDYATEFSVDYYTEDYKLITIKDGGRFLIIPENGTEPQTLSSDIVPLRQPIGNIYLAAAAGMSFFDKVDRIDAITATGIKRSSWYIPAARDAMEAGEITFAGKYSEPDYETLVAGGCPLAIESTMVDRVPEVKEKLGELGIAVLVDHSSLESHPLGRAEWIKLYGALLNEEDQAEAVFHEQEKLLAEASGKSTGKTVAFFYMTKDSVAVAPHADDYISKMIELAGGEYVFNAPDAPARDLATNKIEMESFFAVAQDADYLIYNSTIYGELTGLQEMLDKNDMLQNIKAVQEGNVWCTRDEMFQNTTDQGTMVESLHRIFSGEADALEEVPYFFRLR